MCDICQKMRCPRSCPAYDGNSKRGRALENREELIFLVWDVNHLENRMIDQGRVMLNETKNEA